MVNRGGGGNYLYYCFYDGSSWSGEESTIPGENGTGKASSSLAVGLVVFEGRAYMAHRSSENSGELWYSTNTSKDPKVIA